MPIEPQLIIVTGKDLSHDDLEVINAARKKEFGSDIVINPQPDNEDWDKQYFLIKTGEQLLAFGRLHNVTISFLEKSYHVLGIATVASVVKVKGYGRMLVSGMKECIQKTGLTGLGFCSKNVTPFYEKCGFGIIKDGASRFKHSLPPRFPESDAIYIEGKDKLIEKILQRPDVEAYLSRPHW